MRNANGFGGISNLGGNRRKPYRARVTAGWTEDGKQIYKTIGYFASQQEAYAALLEYHDDPNTIDNKKITFQEIYDRWSNVKYESAGKGAIAAYKMAYNYAKHLNDTPFVKIKADHIRECIKRCTKGKSTKTRIKVLFNQLFEWAMENDIVNKNYATFVKIESNPEDEETSRVPFTNEEIQRLWEHKDTDYIESILIMLYSGIRIKELFILKNKNINLEERWFKTGVKTSAGKDRYIPIHDAVLPLFEKLYDQNYKYFFRFEDKDKEVDYNVYRREIWNPILEKLNMKHLPHDTRHTFTSEMYRKGAKELYLQRIIGHSDGNVTQRYTHDDIADLLKEVNKIDYK